MAIIKFKKREELKILFAVRLPMIISELYKQARNKREANEIIRNAFNMKKNRVINTLELIDGFGNQFSVLVIYDNIMEEKELLKYNLDVEEINFRILEFDFNNKIEVEETIKYIKIKKKIKKNKREARMLPFIDSMNTTSVSSNSGSKRRVLIMEYITFFFLLFSSFAFFVGTFVD